MKDITATPKEISIDLGTGMRWASYQDSLGKMLIWIISVNHSIHYRDKGTGKHEFFITSPKTVNAIRTIPMFDEVYELFKMQKK